MTACGTAVIAVQGHTEKDPQVVTAALQTRHKSNQTVLKQCEVL